MKNSQKEARLIGSPLYEQIFRESGYSPVQKAKLPLHQMGGFLDGNGMLQLKYVEFHADPCTGRILGMAPRDGGYCFDPDMDPGGIFLEEYALCVAKAYGREGLHHPGVHQFRMYIDLHNISYIRTHFEGKTDYDKLLAYEKYTGQSLDRSSSSRLHNRKRKEELGKQKTQVNDKIKTENGLSEFIIQMESDEYGEAERFVTQWDYLRIDEKTGLIDSDPRRYSIKDYKAIVETESFNYCRNDKVKIDGRKGLHTLLDVEPANGKTGYENDVKKEGKKYWYADSGYSEKYK